ncbi:hypothetical protein [uncultured Bifidobacterium sp.]|nr:hypothetical protein [uncultured Bifidobacterium sp.]
MTRRTILTILGVAVGLCLASAAVLVLALLLGWILRSLLAVLLLFLLAAA